MTSLQVKKKTRKRKLSRVGEVYASKLLRKRLRKELKVRQQAQQMIAQSDKMAKQAGLVSPYEE